MIRTKTATFAAVHMAVAFTVGYALTGSVAVGSALALVEPLVNAAAFYFHEVGWNRRAGAFVPERVARIKTGTFAALHMAVAFAVGFALTGNLALSGALALVEPLANTVAYYFHERAWSALRPGTAAPAHA